MKPLLLLLICIISFRANAQKTDNFSKNNPTNFLMGKWILSPTVQNKRNDPFPAETQTVLQIKPNNEAAITFLKKMDGSWEYKRSNQNLTLFFPDEVLKWHILEVTKNSIKINDISNNRTGYLLKQ